MNSPFVREQADPHFRRRRVAGGEIEQLPVLVPQFRRKAIDLREAVEEFHARERRFGAVPEAAAG